MPMPVHTVDKLEEDMRHQTMAVVVNTARHTLPPDLVDMQGPNTDKELLWITIRYVGNGKNGDFELLRQLSR
jgi:hypothetical protein